MLECITRLATWCFSPAASGAPSLLAALVLAGIPATAAEQTNRANPTDFSAFRIIIDRNIFDPSRRPHVTSGPAPKTVDSFSLAGTMNYQKGRFAVFDGTGSDYHKVLETGGAIAGYTLADIGQDAVRLASGTNSLEVKVGMQMRRNEEGRWSLAEAAEPSGTSSQASNSRRRSSDRRESDSAPSRANRSGAGSDNAEPQPDQVDAGGGPPPETGGGEANDPVARMMQRRAQEMNGNESSNSNQ